MNKNNEDFSQENLLKITPLGLNLFSFRITRNENFSFKPGQFSRIGIIKSDGDTVWRPYSILSKKSDKFLEFFSVVIPEGEFTSKLSDLKVSDSVLVKYNSFGYLTLDRFTDGKDLWLLASGTGVAPFLSILQDEETWIRFEKVVLVYSVRNYAELSYQGMLKEILKRRAGGFIYIPIVTREMLPNILNDRVTTLINNGDLERKAQIKFTENDSRIMLCGNPQMIQEVRELLKGKNMRLSLLEKPGQIALEKYW